MQKKILLWSNSSQSGVESILKTTFPSFSKVANETELFRETDLNPVAIIIVSDSILRLNGWEEVFKKTKSLFPDLNYLFTAPSEMVVSLEERYKNSEGVDFLKLPGEILLLEE